MNISILVALAFVADSVNTPERVTLPVVDGATFEQAIHPNGAATYVASTPSGRVGVLVELVRPDLQLSADEKFMYEDAKFVYEDVPGATAWGREMPVWLSARHSNMRYLFEQLGTPNRAWSRWVLFVVRDGRSMTVVADGSSAEVAHRLALWVARSAEWLPLERDSRLIGCFAHLSAPETMCLRSDGTFVSADRQSKAAARNLCRSLHDGRWATGNRTLVLQHLDGRRVFGPYEDDGELGFKGRRWVRQKPCAPADP